MNMMISYQELVRTFPNETSLEELVSLRLFSWGEVKDNSLRVSLKLGEFLNHTFGGMVFTKIS